MLITNRTYKTNTLLEVLVSSDPSGIFAKMFSSKAAKQLASAALQAGKTAAQDIGFKAIDVGRTAAIDAGNKLVAMLLNDYPHPNHKWRMLWFHQNKLPKK